MIHKKSYDICKDFLPVDCPIVDKIIASFEVLQPNKIIPSIECQLFNEKVSSDTKPKKKRLLSPKSTNELSRLSRNVSPDSNVNKRRGLYERKDQNIPNVDRLQANSKRTVNLNHDKLNKNISKKNLKSSFIDSDVNETRPTTGSSTKGTSFLERLENKRPKLNEDDRLRIKESGGVRKRERLTSP